MGDLFEIYNHIKKDYDLLVRDGYKDVADKFIKKFDENYEENTNGYDSFFLRDLSYADFEKANIEYNDYLHSTLGYTNYYYYDDDVLLHTNFHDKPVYCYAGEGMHRITWACYAEMILKIDDGVYSPHSYESQRMHVEEGDILVDCGCAEAEWSLLHADMAHKIILIDNDKKMNPLLERTFAPYKEKTVVYNTTLGNAFSEGGSLLEDMLTEEDKKHRIYVKADIEGFEVPMVHENLNFFKDYNVVFSLCTYHRQHDADILKSIFDSIGYETEFSSGYMNMCFCGTQYPYFRRGMIRGRRKLPRNY